MIELRADIPAEARDWRNHPSIWKWCRQYSPLSEYQHREWLHKINEDPTIKMFGVFENNCNRFLGVCGFTAIDKHNQTAEFSLYIAHAFQRMGFGKKALFQLFQHGFRDLNLNRIWGESYEGNPAMKLFDSLGMTREGCLRKAYYRDGYFIDAIRFGILRHEWVEKWG